MIVKSTMARFRAIIAGALMLCTASTANASLIGDTVQCSGAEVFAAGCAPSSAVVGGGIEFDIPTSLAPTNHLI